MDIIIYPQSECELCSKYDREHDFDVILGLVVLCRKMRWICHKHSNGVVQQVEISGKSTVFVARQIYLVVRHIFHVASEVTSQHNCKTFRYCK